MSFANSLTELSDKVLSADTDTMVDHIRILAKAAAAKGKKSVFYVTDASFDYNVQCALIDDGFQVAYSASRRVGHAGSKLILGGYTVSWP